MKFNSFTNSNFFLIVTIALIFSCKNKDSEKNKVSEKQNYTDEKIKIESHNNEALNDLPIIYNPSFSIKQSYKEGTSKCTCVGWVNPKFLNKPKSSKESNDHPGDQGGGSIRLSNSDEEDQRVAYQLINNVKPETNYRLTFFYAIDEKTSPYGELEFRILTPEAKKPSLVNEETTILKFTGKVTDNTKSIREGQLVELDFKSDIDKVALYAVNSVLNGSDVRIDNFKIEKIDTP